MKISSAFQPFMIHVSVERNYAPESQVKVQDCFRSWILPALGDLEIEAVTLLHVLHLRELMAERQLSPQRQSSVLSALKIFLRFCRETLGADALDPAGIRLPPKPKPDVVWLTKEEVRRMVGTPEVHSSSGLRLKVLVELILATGLRISECLALDRKPFERCATELEIVGKGSKRRTVFFSSRCLFWIKQYLVRRHDQHPAL